MSARDALVDEPFLDRPGLAIADPAQPADIERAGGRRGGRFGRRRCRDHARTIAGAGRMAGSGQGVDPDPVQTDDDDQVADRGEVVRCVDRWLVGHPLLARPGHPDAGGLARWTCGPRPGADRRDVEDLARLLRESPWVPGPPIRRCPDFGIGVFAPEPDAAGHEAPVSERHVLDRRAGEPGGRKALPVAPIRRIGGRRSPAAGCRDHRSRSIRLVRP